MKAILLIAHGSRRQASNEEVVSLAANLKETMGDNYPIILASFLELADPLIPAGLTQCVEHGATEIYVVPYFLSAGRHVQKDVPADIASWQEDNPNIIVHQTPYVGASNMMFDLIEQSVKDYNC